MVGTPRRSLSLPPPSTPGIPQGGAAPRAALARISLNKEGHRLVALCIYLLTYLRLLSARAVGAAAAGGVAVRRRIAAAVTVVVGHVFDPFYFGGWRVRFKKRGRFAAPRKSRAQLSAAVPVLVVIRVALVGVIVVVRVGVHVRVPFYFWGLGLDVPGDRVTITTLRPVDEGPGRLRCGGLAHRFLGRGLHGGKLSGISELARRWVGERQSGR